jgi:hypothetical protein
MLMGCTLAAPGLPGGRLPSPPLGGFKGNCGFSGSSIFFVAALQTASAASLLAKSFQRLFGGELGAFTASLFFLNVAVSFQLSIHAPGAIFLSRFSGSEIALNACIYKSLGAGRLKTIITEKRYLVLSIWQLGRAGKIAT